MVLVYTLQFGLYGDVKFITVTTDNSTNQGVYKMSAINDVGRLDRAIKAAGIPIDGVGDITGVTPQPYWHVVTRGDGVVLRIDYQASATPTQIQQGDAIAMTFDLHNRGPRPLYAIYVDLQALSAAQKIEVWNDLSSGSPKKYLLGTGPNTAAIGALDWAVTDSGATGASLTAARLRIATAYVQDNPEYLVHPSFDPGINVPGDQNV